MAADRERAPPRRAALRLLAGGLAAALPQVHAATVAGPANYHGGRIDPPLAVPAWPVVLADGRRTALSGLLRGRTTAVHAMFTGCTTTCPIQGAVFQQVQALLPDLEARGVQLLSLSLSPLEDSPQRLQAWLGRFGAGPGWLAASPEVGRLDDLLALLFGGARPGGLADHATAVALVDRRAELVWRTRQLPGAEALAAMLARA